MIHPDGSGFLRRRPGFLLFALACSALIHPLHSFFKKANRYNLQKNCLGFGSFLLVYS
ncbi:hypothetical protein AB434_0152 [Heyndrickxia coagulans]|jgi:hypothetical protein|uniref:Uncharacterized protein n=1 Tax=Heyndrickxia coagulans TaxID=1398 RepID=A0A0C5C0P6_HEYCO|nr:hypothetical protein SB48_HM08orf01576 [Heyndrickxia coagulans]AKN52557.1 hypothetical protein AB434_0152 [Heyndrickxia coagulans]KWZ81575.1 hypothetical protein HMPREF3213_01990 [Heyndrickxia coagulans]KYC65443.1 hypothetical protein B4100_2338 [Heyndrickxia coagulans]KYC79749.1 hypothetical protein B4096_2234 [Heyndrickxia coagulans]